MHLCFKSVVINNMLYNFLINSSHVRKKSSGIFLKIFFFKWIFVSKIGYLYNNWLLLCSAFVPSVTRSTHFCSFFSGHNS